VCDRRGCDNRGVRLRILAAAAVAAALVSTAEAAAPNYIYVRGPGLDRPVLLADWDENLDLFTAIVSSPVAGKTATRGLARRPRLELAYFWAWGSRPRPTSGALANQHGSFWAATGTSRALIQLAPDSSFPELRIASAKVLRILARHGIPVRR
jgi:hypothetical protein